MVGRGGRNLPSTILLQLRPNICGVRDEEIHAARRRAVGNKSSAQIVAAMEVYIDKVMVDLIQRLERRNRRERW